MAMALQLRSQFVTLRNQSLLRHFSSSPPPDGGDDYDDKKEPKPSSFSSHFSDVKASLKQTPPSPRKIAPPPLPSSDRPSFSQLNPPKGASYDEIRKNLFEFRRRSAPPLPGEKSSSVENPISFKELFKRNMAANGDEGKTNAFGSNKSGNFSIDAIRENLRQLKLNHSQGIRGPNDRFSGTKVVNPLSLKSFKETLKMKPDEPGTSFSGPVGGIDQLPSAVFGKEAKMKTDFVKTYDYGELGKKLQKLRSTGAKGGFSLHELNDRLRKLRELEENQLESTTHGISYKDLRESLAKLKTSSDDKTKRSTLQRFDILSNLGGGTPTFMLSPPKEQLVEQYYHPDNLSSEEKLKLELKRVRDEFKMSESDCGSSRVQVAQLTTKIKHLSSVLHKKDKHSRKGLIAMVQKRKKLLKYLRRTDWDSYCFVISKLGLRDNPDYKH